MVIFIISNLVNKIWLMLNDYKLKKKTNYYKVNNLILKL